MVNMMNMMSVSNEGQERMETYSDWMWTGEAGRACCVVYVERVHVLPLWYLKAMWEYMHFLPLWYLKAIWEYMHYLPLWYSTAIWGYMHILPLRNLEAIWERTNFVCWVQRCGCALFWTDHVTPYL